MTKRKRELESRLEGRQLRAANLLVEREFVTEGSRQTYEQIAKEVGVDRRTLLNWRTKNAAFIEYTSVLADAMLSADRALVYRQLMRLITGPNPSVKAIDLYFRRFGLLTDRQIVETAEAGGGRSIEDIERDIADLDELLK